jgi:hypothetical protein
VISEGGLYSTRDVKGGGGLLPPLYAIQLFKQGVGRGRGAAAVRRGTGVRGARVRDVLEYESYSIRRTDFENLMGGHAGQL